MKFLLIPLVILGAILYRLGGTNKGTLWRDIGVSVVTLITCLLLGLLTDKVLVNIGTYFLTFGLSWGALSAYWGQDEKKYGHFWHGLGLALAVLPIVFLMGNWVGFLIRTIVLTGFITIWSEYAKWDILEEWGRGFAVVATIPLLLI